MTAGFAHLTMLIPTHSKDVFDLAASLGEADASIDLMRRNGLSRIPVAVGWTAVDLIGEAIGQVLREAPHLKNKIGLAMLVHSLPVPAPPGIDLVSICLEQHGLSDVPTILVSGQPCAILHQAIALGNDWLSSEEDSVILIVGADMANHDQERIYFGSAMGDAAIAGLFMANASSHQVLATTTDTMLYAWEGEYSPSRSIAQFRSANPAKIRTTIERCVAQAGIELSDVALICPHTPNRLIWDSVAALLRVPREFIYDNNIMMTGHLNSNDSFVHYLHAIKAGRLLHGDIALLVNPGFGGTRGCTLLRY